MMRKAVVVVSVSYGGSMSATVRVLAIVFSLSAR
jgi:hypothetical protein